MPGPGRVGDGFCCSRKYPGPLFPTRASAHSPAAHVSDGAFGHSSWKNTTQGTYPADIRSGLSKWTENVFQQAFSTWRRAEGRHGTGLQRHPSCPFKMVLATSSSNPCHPRSPPDQLLITTIHLPTPSMLVREATTFTACQMQKKASRLFKHPDCSAAFLTSSLLKNCLLEFPGGSAG